MLYAQAIFLMFAACGGLFFLIKRRQFDYFSLAFFSALIYFLPGFFGATSYHVGDGWSDMSIDPEVYWIMIFVILSIWFSAWVSSYAPKLLEFNIALPSESLVSKLLMFSASAGFIGLLVTSGSEVLQAEKEIVMQSLGRWHILFYTAATIGLPVAYLMRQYLLAGLFLASLSFDLFLGFRSALSIGIISVLVVMLYAQGRQRLIAANWKIILAALMFGLLMFGYKEIAFAVKAGMWDLVWSNLNDANTYLFMFTHSEPFVVQQILNEVVASRFETNADHIFSSLYQLMLFAPELGAETITFNSLFQPSLFPDVEYGLAANIWAQMWSAGGWTLLIVFTLVFNMVLALGNATLRARSIVLRAGLAPVFVYWAFYIHRNELGYALNLEKRILLLLFFVIVIVSIIKKATSQGSGQQKLWRSGH